MRCWPIFALLILNVWLPGCGRKTSRQQMLEQRLEQIRDQVRAFEKTHTRAAEQTFPDVISVPAAYYKDGPQQDRGPDGEFPAGTAVRIIERAGSYVRVESADGVEAYIAADAIKQAEEIVPDDAAVVKGENLFAVQLYRQLCTSKKNLFFSPSSISMALAMTYAGAAGDTKAEMAKVLHFDVSAETLHATEKTLLERWTTTAPKEGIELVMANRLWGQVGYVFLPRFLRVLQDNYAAELGRLDFERGTTARETINSWVAKQTKNKVTDLVPEGILSADTRLVLTNAIYFHGTWSKAFDTAQTHDEVFYRTTSDTQKIPMMHREGKFGYQEIDDLKVLELPYGAGEFSMVVLLPNKTDGLADLEAKLNVENLQRWIGGAHCTDKIEVYLPKFRLGARLDLNKTLQALGMKSAFDAETADFSAMSEDKDLFISAVMHEAYVDVNEQGTEAAAATGVAMGVTAMPPVKKPVPVFRADHPFIFLIRDNPSGAILFLGRLVDPAT